VLKGVWNLLATGQFVGTTAAAQSTRRNIEGDQIQQVAVQHLWLIF
jgi:hypothetical protein